MKQGSLLIVLFICSSLKIYAQEGSCGATKGSSAPAPGYFCSGYFDIDAPWDCGYISSVTGPYASANLMSTDAWGTHYRIYGHVGDFTVGWNYGTPITHTISGPSSPPSSFSVSNQVAETGGCYNGRFDVSVSYTDCWSVCNFVAVNSQTGQSYYTSCPHWDNGSGLPLGTARFIVPGGTYNVTGKMRFDDGSEVNLGNQTVTIASLPGQITTNIITKTLPSSRCENNGLIVVGYSYATGGCGSYPTAVLHTDVGDIIGYRNRSTYIFDYVPNSTTVTYEISAPNYTTSTGSFAFMSPVLCLNTWFLDADGDGYYTLSQEAEAQPGPGWWDNPGSGGGDCNDDPENGGIAINPSATEICGNGIDENCNGMEDDVCGLTWYMDADGDGYGDPATGQTYNTSPGDGFVENGDDCNDENENFYPDAPTLADVTQIDPEHFGCPGAIHVKLIGAPCADFMQVRLYNVSPYLQVEKVMLEARNFSMDDPQETFDLLKTELISNYEIEVLKGTNTGGDPTYVPTFNKLVNPLIPEEQSFDSENFNVTQPGSFNCPGKLHVEMNAVDCYDLWRVMVYRKNPENGQEFLDFDTLLLPDMNAADIEMRIPEGHLTYDYRFKVLELYHDNTDLGGIFIGTPVELYTHSIPLSEFDFALTQSDMELITENDFKITPPTEYHCAGQLLINLPGNDCFKFWKATLRNRDNQVVIASDRISSSEHVFFKDFFMTDLTNNYELEIEKWYPKGFSYDYDFQFFKRNRIFHFPVTQPDAKPLNSGDYNVLYPHPISGSECARLHVNAPSTDDCFSTWEVKLKNLDVSVDNDVIFSGPKTPDDKTYDQDFRLGVGGQNHFELSVIRNYTNPEGSKVSTFNFPLNLPCDGTLQFQNKTPVSAPGQADGSATFVLTRPTNLCLRQRHELRVTLRNLATGTETSATAEYFTEAVTVSNLAIGSYSVSYCYSDCSCKGDNVMTVDISGNSINTGPVAGSPFCSSRVMERNIPVSYNSNAVFESNNVFSVELSNPGGSFMNGTTILQDQPGTSASGTIMIYIPRGTPPGLLYRIRVKSSNPQIDGADNGSNLILLDSEDKDHDRYAVCEGDLVDDDSTVAPGHVEICDGKDNNYDGQVDEGLRMTGELGSISCTNCAAGVCKNSTHTFIVRSFPEATYYWTAPPNARILNGQGNSSVSVGFLNQFTNGALTVVATDKCNATKTTSMDIYSIPFPPGTIFGPTTVCRNTFRTFSCSQSIGASRYKWRVSGSARIVGDDTRTNVTVEFRNNGATVEVRAENDCGSSSYRSYPVTMGACKNDENESNETDSTLVEDSDLTGLNLIPLVPQEGFISAYPNPFNDKLNIEFSLPEDSRAKLEIFNVAGQVIATLFDGEVKANEEYKFEFTPNGISRGVIFYRLQTETQTYYDKVVMMK